MSRKIIYSTSAQTGETSITDQLSTTVAQEIVAAFEAGELDRRTALGRLVGLGYSGAAAFAAIGVVLPNSTAAAPSLSKAEIESLVVELNRVVMHPDVLKALEDVKKTGPDTAYLLAAMEKVVEVSLRPEFKLINRESMRASLRIFEKEDKETTNQRLLIAGNVAQRKLVASPPWPTNLRIQDRFHAAGVKLNEPWQPNAGTLCASLGQWLCVSYGQNV